jgi:hypothetical protein
MSKWRVALGGDLMVAIANAIGVDGQKCRRIVLDAPYDGPVVVYVEMLTDTRILEFNWKGELKDTEVKFAPKPDEGKPE